MTVLIGMSQRRLPPADALIEGIVLCGESPEPLRGAQIRANGFVTPANFNPLSNSTAEIAATAEATSDEKGRFSLKLAAGTYTVRSQHSECAQATMGSGAAVVVLRPQEQLTSFALKLPSHGIVTGRIDDERGRPLFGFKVEALTIGTSLGRSGLVATASAITDDRGEYRLVRLEPGEYYIAVAPPPRRAMTTQGVYPRTYYPGSLNTDGAASISVVSGNESRVGMGLRPEKVGRVSGTITSAADPVPGRRQVTTLFLVAQALRGLHEATPPLIGTASINGATGAFTIDNVPVGSYDLIAVASSPERGNTGTARIPVQVGEKGVAGIPVSILPGVNAAGRVVLNNGMNSQNPARPLSSVSVSLVPSGWMPPVAAVTLRQKLAEDGTFAFQNLPPGTYSVVLSGLLALNGAYLSDIRGNGVDPDAATITIENESPRIEINLSSPGEVVQGVVRANDKQIADAIVILSPRQPFDKNQQRYKTAQTDAFGRYIFSGVAPGEYVVFASNRIPNGAMFSPEFLSSLVLRGTFINVRPGFAANTQIQLLPGDVKILR
jgi:hypothetical protein